MSEAIKTIGVILLFFFTLACLCSACGSSITTDNFEKITTEMTFQEVKAILGEPTETTSINFGPLSGTMSIWKGKGITINIQFLNSKVKAKQLFKG